ncbi:unnamed protein product [Anisakis simplex]|uniref:AAA_28 domain-containing protein n=1 Tax=Anisakis simplex TaxID=6269 RepID=A0A0M3JSJ2_ANISI|nr:unnamed protein product [Anisakis simplex]
MALQANFHRFLSILRVIEPDKSSESESASALTCLHLTPLACSAADIIASRPATALNRNGRFRMDDPNPSAPKRRIYKVVLTGGPCGGKTTGQDRLRTFFESIGWKVYTIPETATVLLGGGVKFSELNGEQSYAFQKDLLLTMLRIESVVFFNQAELSSADYVLVICDRGAMDPSAYIDNQLWQKLLQEADLELFSLREDRYDQGTLYGTSRATLTNAHSQIIHLTTAADGAVDYYTLANNSIRSEGVAQALEQDRLTRNAWLGHPRVDVIDNTGCKSFEDKIIRVIAAVCDRMGLCTQDRLAFNSRKRKWLVASIDESQMPRSEVYNVWHRYLCTEDPKVQVRLRSRSQNGRTSYSVTTRHFTLPETVETRMQLTTREYSNYKKMEDGSRAAIHKERRCFMFHKQYFHIDIYKTPLPPFCDGKLLMILETYTTAPAHSAEPELPDFMKIEREVTGDLTYSMYNIAKIDRKSSKC